MSLLGDVDLVAAVARDWTVWRRRSLWHWHVMMCTCDVVCVTCDVVVGVGSILEYESYELVVSNGIVGWLVVHYLKCLLYLLRWGDP